MMFQNQLGPNSNQKIVEIEPNRTTDFHIFAGVLSG